MNSAPTAEEQLPPLPEWKTNGDIPADVWDEAIMFVADAPVAEWLVITRRLLLTALRENREKDARIAELEKQRRNTVSLEAFREVLNTVEADRAKLRAVSDALDTFTARIRAIVEGK